MVPASLLPAIAFDIVRVVVAIFSLIEACRTLSAPLLPRVDLLRTIDWIGLHLTVVPSFLAQALTCYVAAKLLCFQANIGWLLLVTALANKGRLHKLAYAQTTNLNYRYERKSSLNTSLESKNTKEISN